jgi:dTDP-4-dehydrorhamnose reductase
MFNALSGEITVSMNRSILLLGAAGMAGHVVRDYLSTIPSFKVTSTARSANDQSVIGLDVTCQSRLEEVLLNTKPDFVVNCIGALVSQSENDLESAIRLNSLLPNTLSRMGKSFSFRLIHVSTDCVFSGKKGDYTELDYRDGDTNYARTKAIGEVQNDRDLTIRTSIVGPEIKSNGTGLLDWFLKQNSSVVGFSRVYWSGVSTLELAKAIHYAIEKGTKGLIHLCPSQKIAKSDLLRVVAKIWKKNTTINDDDSYKSDKSLVNTREDWEYKVPDYESMFCELKGWMDQFPERYVHYR